MRGRTLRLRHEAKKLVRKVAPRVKPEPLAPPVRLETIDEPRRRSATLSQLRHQVLFGEPRESGPFPSVGLSELEASLLRASALETRAFSELSIALKRDPSTGPLHFGAAWPSVAWIFNLGPRPRSTAPLEDTDIAAFERAQWEAYLASDECADDIERGVFVPGAAKAASDERDISNGELPPAVQTPAAADAVVIDKVRHVGDTDGKDWNAELTKCIAITSR